LRKHLLHDVLSIAIITQDSPRESQDLAGVPIVEFARGVQVSGCQPANKVQICVSDRAESCALQMRVPCHDLRTGRANGLVPNS
jgi:hypothetical protein